MAKPKVALVCDWLTTMGGAEKLLLSLHKAYPDAPIYTSVFSPERCPEFAKLDVRTTFLQHLPKFIRNYHQLFPVFRAYAFRRLDLSEYDIIISSASAESKAVRKRADATHICYCHTPTRYYWSHYEEYKKHPGFGVFDPIIRLLIPPFVNWMRKLDLQAVSGVDHFIANSTAVAARIKKYYGHESTVIHPPVDLKRFENLSTNGKRQGFVVVGRQVPYKRIDLAIEACNKLKVPLTVYGNGSEHQKLVNIAGPTIKFVVGANDQQIAVALTKAKGFIVAQQEDFGIVQIEALAAGCPIIAYAKDGALDINVQNETCAFFNDQNVQSLCDAIEKFNNISFDSQKIKARAKLFSEDRFINKIKDFVEAKS